MAVTVRERALNQAFADLADSLVNEFDVSDLLNQLVTLVTRLFHAESASILLRDERGEVQVLAASTAGIRTLELYQLLSGQGPGLECLRTGKAIATPDLDAASQLWPLFVPTAREHGQVAVHALALRVREQVIGALDLYSAKPGDLPERDLHDAQALADLVTMGILQERASRQRRMIETAQDVLHDQFVLEQAKGMLAASANVSMDEAFDLLRHYAGYRESRVMEVAIDLAAGRIGAAVIIEAGTLRRSSESPDD